MSSTGVDQQLRETHAGDGLGRRSEKKDRDADGDKGQTFDLGWRGTGNSGMPHPRLQEEQHEE